MSDNASRDDVGRALLSFGKAPLQYRTFERPSQAKPLGEAHAQPLTEEASAAPPPPPAAVPAPPQTAASSRFPLLGAALSEAASVNVGNIVSWALPEESAAEAEPPERQPEPPPLAAESPRKVSETPRSVSAPPAVPPGPVVPLVPVVPRSPGAAHVPAWAPRDPDSATPRLSVVATRDDRAENPRSLSHIFRVLGAGQAESASGDVQSGSSLSRLLGSL